MANRTLVKVNELSIGHEGRTLCSGISFEIREGECIMLCGANGSGKTTLMKTLAAGHDSSASIQFVEGCECIMIPARIPKVSGFTLKEFVRISCFSKSDLHGKLSPNEEAIMEEAIRNLNLEHLADRDISTLSDGEFQKAGIASALVRKASVILLDEPTAFLDAQNRISVLNTLKEICGRGHRPAVVFSTHDLHDGLQVCSKVFAIGVDETLYISKEDTSEAKSDTISKIFR